MARIAEAELERLKAGVSVERLAEGRGIVLRRHGADLLGLCPFHEDHEPSLVISPAKNLWHCLGACQSGGSCVDWVMRAQGVSFRHAVELLRADAAFAAGDPVRMAKDTRVRTLPAPVEVSADDQEVLGQVVTYYQTTLAESPEALRYLESRGLADREAIAHFRLGFANRTLGLRLPPMRSKGGQEMRTRLQHLGLLRESGHEHFNGSVVMPVTDAAGHVVEMYGRKVTAGLKPGTPLHLYLPGPHHGVWNESSFTRGGAVIVCEALLDALTFWVHGLHDVTAAYGIEGFTQEHVDAFTRAGVERVYIAYDHDAAGDMAAVQLASRLAGAGLDVFRVQFPQGQDANGYACEELSTAGERLSGLMRRALWIAKGNWREHVIRASERRDADAQRTVGKGGKDSASPVPDATVSVPAPTARTTVPAQEIATPPVPSFAAFAAPATTTAPPPVETGSDDELHITMGERAWRVRGLDRLTTDATLKVNLLLRMDGDQFFVDTLDLYIARQRQAFATQAATETGVLEETVRRDLGRVLLHLEEHIAKQRKARQEQASLTGTLSDEDRTAGLALLRDPALLGHIVADFDRIGVVGEATNTLVAYLAATSRLLERPLAVVVQSSSAAGKSALLEATLALLPDTARVKYSAMTGQSLFYMAEQELAHKVLAVVEEAGAEKAAYALKLLQSEGELSIASTGKDPQSGRLVTQEYHVNGPVALFLTTTAIDVDEELLNRCLVLTVDEERGQTQAIHRRQRERETLGGLLADRERQEAIRRHSAAQTLLRPLAVVNPYAAQLTFGDRQTRSRRDHQKYLTLIRTIALLHQYQREVKHVQDGATTVEYIEVIPSDIAVANRLANEVLGRSLDEVPPQTRRLLVLLDELVVRQMRERDLTREEVRLTRKQIRDHCGWGATQVGLHLARLADLDYVATYLGGRGRTAVYELVWDGSGGAGVPQLHGLIDPETLTYDAELAGSEPNLSGPAGQLTAPNRPQIGPLTAHYRSAPTTENSNVGNGYPPAITAELENGTTRAAISETVVHAPVAPAVTG